VCQWNNRDCIIVLVLDEISGDMREDLWRHPVDWLQNVPQGWDDSQNILRCGFQAVDLFGFAFVGYLSTLFYQGALTSDSSELAGDVRGREISRNLEDSKPRFSRNTLRRSEMERL
jgi:hypothetical protein